MNIFDFLEKINHEKFEFNISYDRDLNFTVINVDAFSEIWKVTFDRDELNEINIFCLKNQEDNLFLEGDEALESLFNRPVKAWKKASKMLGIAFETPFNFKGKNGVSYKVTGLLPDFGEGKGTILTSRKDDNEAVTAALTLKNYNHTSLNPAYYDKYNEDLFKNTLRDWGWSGKGQKPKWF